MLWGGTGGRAVVRAGFFRRCNGSSRALPPFVATPIESSLSVVSRLSRSRGFKSSARVLVVKPFLLADIGEGM